MRRLRFLIGAITVLGALSLSASVHAERPEIIRWSDNNHDHPDVFTDECGPGADLVGVFDIQGSDTRFFDSEGTLVRVVILINFNGVLTRSDTGNTIKDPGRIRIEIDLVMNKATITGLDYNMVYPGVGAVFQNIGRKVFEPDDELVFNAGPNDFEEGMNPGEEACAALA